LTLIPSAKQAVIAGSPASVAGILRLSSRYLLVSTII